MVITLSGADFVIEKPRAVKKWSELPRRESKRRIHMKNSNYVNQPLSRKKAAEEKRKAKKKEIDNIYYKKKCQKKIDQVKQ